ncbi:hypothetical protein [Trinickia mobilis]|uniref:hypothetical protein n=1 Tax=Trinickia mobilis TaxID=2816356 RepID=UPI001A8DE17A|nr:hypothetical protein [Trinickia mobilis]
MTDAELSHIRDEAATIADDWAERQAVEPSKEACNARFIREVVRLLTTHTSASERIDQEGGDRG